MTRGDGRWRHPLWATYWNMLRRCGVPGSVGWKNYGARGVSVCQRWREDFWMFVEDMGEKPTPKHELDRVDNDGNYEPGNVRWATRAENLANRRPRVPPEFCKNGHPWSENYRVNNRGHRFCETCRVQARIKHIQGHNDTAA